MDATSLTLKPGVMSTRPSAPFSSRVLSNSYRHLGTVGKGRWRHTVGAGRKGEVHATSVYLQHTRGSLQAPSDSGEGPVAAYSRRWKEGGGACNERLPSTHKGQSAAPNEALQDKDAAGCCQTCTSIQQITGGGEEGRLGMQSLFTCSIRVAARAGPLGVHRMPSSCLHPPCAPLLVVRGRLATHNPGSVPAPPGSSIASTPPP